MKAKTYKKMGVQLSCNKKNARIWLFNDTDEKKPNVSYELTFVNAFPISKSGANKVKSSLLCLCKDKGMTSLERVRIMTT